MNLRDLDLNLLVLLNTLLEKKSVTQAAEALGMSQPAMSHALSRLRDTFDDRLLVRSGRDMVPTARAEGLREPLKHVLDGVDALVNPVRAFSPEDSERTFRILTNGFAGYAFLPELVRELQQYSARIDLRVEVISGDNLRDMLGSGDADAALVVGAMHALPQSLMHRKLYDDPFVTVIRRDHPALKNGEELSFDNYLRLNHVLVSPRGHSHGVVDDLLEEQGLQRHVSVVVPNFISVPGILERSDMVVTVPRSIACSFANSPKLARIEPPMTLPVGTLFALWHERLHDDEAHRWFRGIMSDASDVMGQFSNCM